MWKRLVSRLSVVVLATAGATGCGSEQERELAKMETETQLDIVARAIDAHRARARELPAALAELVERKLLLDKQVVDAWGRPLRYEVKGPREYVLCSGGPDEASAGDDICRAPKG